MIRSVVLLALLSPLAVHAAVADTRFEKSLRMLDPTTRLEQLCDFTALTRIDKDKTFRADRAIGNALVDTKVTADTIEAKGAAFRSRGKWYQFAFTCRATPDHMKVLSFDYQLGAEIPEDKWQSYGLWR